MIRLVHIISTIILLIPFAGFSQRDSLLKVIDEQVRKDLKKESRDVNKGIYIQEGFPRYKGDIRSSGDTAIKYDDVILIIYNQRAAYRSLFEKGIFYPSILTGNISGRDWEKERGIQITNRNRLFDFTKLSIGDFEEIKSLQNSSTVKRIRFWVFRPVFVNPWEYIMDLENSSATEGTDFKTFIEGCKLIYIKFVTLII